MRPTIRRTSQCVGTGKRPLVASKPTSVVLAKQCLELGLSRSTIEVAQSEGVLACPS